MKRAEYLEAGKIVNTHGVRGDVKSECWCDDLSVMTKDLSVLYRKKGKEYIPFKITKASPFKGMVLLHFEGIDSFEDANSLRGEIVYAKREDLPLEPGAYFIADILGLPVVDADSGKEYGILKNVNNGAAGQLYEIETENGMVLLPVVPQFVKEVDPDKGIFVTPIPGFFDEI
ncbi:MAG: 16S rRNA processing protein RimM [Ruminococcaceae bacterium]|nr:16S rRNA processing protein RimM [Oscillospiraceae bacterium]